MRGIAAGSEVDSVVNPQLVETIRHSIVIDWSRP
jgi:hypothetical protein